MFNVALAISILVASVFPLGLRLLLVFVPPTLLTTTFGPLGTQLIILFSKYFFGAIIIYIIFRLTKIEQKFNFKARGARLILTANMFVIFFGIVRALASLVEGGGAAFVVAQFGPFVFWPAWLAIIIGLVRLWRNQSASTAS